MQKKDDHQKQDDLRADPIRFASLIAHQLQSPLSAVSMALQSVLAEYSGPLLPRQRGALERANARCDQAITTIRRMLAIIKAEESGETESVSTALADALREAHAQNAAEASKRGISLMLELPSEDTHVAMAEPALAEILSVLLNNALKYTPDQQGEIRISAEENEKSSTVAISIGDSGIGVPEKDMDKIFAPFYRSSSARESAQPGIGLGLAFVKSIVKAAGGSVTIRKSKLGGAEFTVELPMAKPSASTAAAHGKKPSMKVVIIGGVTAGPKAAAKIFRLQPETDVTIIERGSVMSYAGCGLPYYVSGVVRDQRRLTSTPAGVARDPVFFRNVMNVHVMNQAEACEIDRKGKRVRVTTCATGRESWLKYDKLLLTTGGSALVTENLRTDLKNVFTLHGVRDAEGIKTALAENKATDVVIVGGGLIGIEMTEAFVKKGARVTILEKQPRILPMLDHDMSLLVERHLESNGVRIVTGAAALSLKGKDGAVSSVVTDKGVFRANMVILAIGIRPNVELAAGAGLEIGETGAIKVNKLMQTSDPDIYAAGDCVENINLVTGKPCYVPLGSTATKQGRVAAINICGGKEAFPGIIGTSIFRAFDYSVGRTGLGEAEARKAGYDVVTVLAPGPDRDHFMPTAGIILLKMIVDANSRRLLGVQATGPGALDKRIDVAALAISAGMTLDAIANADLGYAPSFSTALDNIITAANIARNKLDGHMKGISPGELQQMIRNRENFDLLDVRTPQEYEDGHLPAAILVPLGSLRGRISEFPRDKEIITYCDISLRGYEAALILTSAGFSRVRVLEGGMAMWPYEVVS